ncbi:MAG: hypothetical protein LC111_11060 [Bacteroidia bacterium]|nr:hypothetical protein [Bacteroidia bacterium]
MAIQITRADPLANVCTETHTPGILSVERFADMDAALASLRARGIPLTDAHAEKFRAHSDTQFAWAELINGGDVAYQARVLYDVREVA